MDVERHVKPPVVVEKDVGVDSQPASECRGADEAFIIGDRFIFVDKTGERKLEAEHCAARVVAAADRRGECHGIAAEPRYRRAGRSGDDKAELQSRMSTSSAVYCLTKKKAHNT